ncbi:hypothetical protein B0H13DRAFT_1600397, partial [Mycena leptocephala]
RAFSSRPSGLLDKRQSEPYNVTWPDSTVTWIAGNTYNVTWIAPHSGQGSLSLSTTSLSIDLLLTAPFDLLRGTLNVTIPSNISNGGDYIILLAQVDSSAESTYWAESAPFGIGEAVTTSGTEVSLDGSTFRFSSTVDVATTPLLSGSSITGLPSPTSSSSPSSLTESAPPSSTGFSSP